VSVGVWISIGCVLVWGAQSAAADEPCVATVSLSASGVTGGSSLKGIVALNAPAPSSGLAIRLSSSHPNAEVSGSIIAEPGQTSANFQISTAPVAVSTAATITAATGSCSADTGVTLQPAVLAGLDLSVNAARGNASLTGTVTLNGPAPAGGAVLKLQSSDPLVNVPASVTILADQSSANFPITTGTALAPGSVALTATYGASVHSALLTLVPGI